MPGTPHKLWIFVGVVLKEFRLFASFLFFFSFSLDVDTACCFHQAEYDILRNLAIPRTYVCCLHLDELPDERSSHTGIKYGISSVYTSPGSGICHERNAGSSAAFLPGLGAPSQRLPVSTRRSGEADYGPADGSRRHRPSFFLARAPGCSRSPEAVEDSGARGGSGGRPQSSSGSQGALGTFPQKRNGDGDH